MEKKSYSELMEKCPNLYMDKDEDMKYTAMCWGIDCGSGWYDIIADLSFKLEAEILKLPKEARKNVKASQVKEKFGGLRFYMSSATDRMHKLISEASHKANETCERCGAGGATQTDGGWISTLCEECKK